MVYYNKMVVEFDLKPFYLFYFEILIVEYHYSEYKNRPKHHDLNKNLWMNFLQLKISKDMLFF